MAIEIINDDCFSVAQKLSSDYTVVTDPPYNIGYGYDEYKDLLPSDEYFEKLAKITSDKSIVIHYPEDIVKLSIKKQQPPQKMVAWVYPSNTRRQWRSVAWFGHKPDFSLAGQPYKNPNDKRIKKLIEAGKECRLYDWWEINQVKNVSQEKTEHPCQIPLEVMLRILKITNPKKVFDPFAGSGTTLLACKILGIDAIGSEISQDYCKIIQRRLDETLC